MIPRGSGARQGFGRGVGPRSHSALSGALTKKIQPDPDHERPGPVRGRSAARLGLAAARPARRGRRRGLDLPDDRDPRCAGARAPLTTMLASDVSAIDHWLGGRGEPRRGDGGRPAGAPDVSELLALARRTGATRRPQGGAGAGPPARDPGARGLAAGERRVLVLDPGGLIVARLVDERIGERVVLAVADAASGPWRDAVFLPPTLKQRFANVPMAFLMVPLRDASGAAIAAFAFRIPRSGWPRS